MTILISAIKKHYHQFMFVFMAFTSLVIIGYYYTSNMTERHLESQGIKIVTSTNAELTKIFTEADVALNALAYSVEFSTDSDYAAILKDWALYFAKNLTYYDSFTGARAVINGAFYCSVGFLPPDGYEITEQAWYKNAVENPGRLKFTVFETDIFTLDKTVTLSRALTDIEGEVYAVVSIDIKAATIEEIINRVNIGGYGYGFLADSDDIIFLHDNPEFIGQNIEAAACDNKNMAVEFSGGKPVIAQTLKDYNGISSIIFSSKIVNNWTLGVIVPRETFFGSLYDMTFVLSVMGLMLVLMVGYFMTLLTFEKMRSDEENQNKSSFLAKMSHELRTPLNAVLGMSELILREDIPHNIYENALSIKQASTNLISIINDILDYSKIESGKLEIVPINYYFSSLINDVVSIIRMRLTDKPIKLAVNIDALTPNNLFGDEVRIRQVFINILSNAVKYTKEGSIIVDIHGEITGKDTYNFVIDVTDTGIGIKEEDLNKLFGDFVQINMAANKGVEGTGLGLVIARNICRAMGGDITVKSVYNQGSTFTIKFLQKFTDYQHFANVTNASQKKVLLYEARLVYADSISKTLRNLGVPFFKVQNQNQFYEELKKTDYPYIFVSSFLFSSAKNILEKLETDAKLVIISEFGEVVSAKCDRIITMPSHCVPIANVLNDVTEDTKEHDNAETGIRFIAPEARVLIVDDIATNLKVAEGLMAPYNMKVDTAKSGMEAIERVQKIRYDVVFMDHMMPGMDGIEATERIRKIEEKDNYYKELPIIALTAVAISGVKEMFLQNGMNDFIAKPIEMAKLNTILEKWIPKQKQKKVSAEVVQISDDTLQIEGIDTKVGLSMTGGTMDTYLRVLAIFYNDCIEKTEEISKALANNDLYLYTTYVHALKSAAANVGATKVSEMAKQLESAGKNEDVIFITENNDEFFNVLRALLDNIKPVIEDTERDDENDSDLDMDKLKSDLTNLKEALDDMDISVIDSIVAKLQAVKYTGKLRDLLEGMFHCILMFEYGEAIAKIEEIMDL